MVKKYNEFIKEDSDTQLEMGIKIEKEHNDIYEYLCKYLKDNELEMPLSEDEFAEKIAKAHLREMDDYYTRLIKMEND